MQFNLPNGVSFNTDNPKCPTCGGKMWDNRTSKRSPNHPDFRCQDKKCKDGKGYQTGVYVPKDMKDQSDQEAITKPVTTTTTTHKKSDNYGNSVPPSMYGAWAKDMVVAFVEKGIIKTIPEAQNEFSNMLKSVGDSLEIHATELNAKNPIPVSEQERQVPAGTMPELPDTSDTVGVPDPLDAVAQELSGDGLDEITTEDLSNLDL